MQPRKYGPFPYVPIHDRPRLTWPNGAHVALWVIPNIEFFALDEQVPPGSGGTGAPVPDVPSWSMRDYGNRIGVFRMMQTMSRYGVRGTVALNSDVCEQHPEIIAEGEKLGWEWMGHNESNTRRLNALAPGEESGVIGRTLATIAKASGRSPVGWLGAGLQETWNTLDLLAANGVEYVADWINDDQPYQMKLDEGRTILSLPYSYEINDKSVFESHHFTADQFRDMICRQFDVLYREGAESGRVMAICLHPYITGVPYRIGSLDAALEYISGHDCVWKATGAEIAQSYRDQMNIS